MENELKPEHIQLNKDECVYQLEARADNAEEQGSMQMSLGYRHAALFLKNHLISRPNQEDLTEALKWLKILYDNDSVGLTIKQWDELESFLSKRQGGR